MKRSLRNCTKSTVIEISDSEDDCKPDLDDDLYVPEENKVEDKSKKRKVRSVKTNSKASADNGVKIEKPKRATKKRTQKIDDAETPEKKKRKITKSVKKEINSEIKDEKDVTEEEQNIDKVDLLKEINTKYNIDLKSQGCKEWTDVEYLSEVNNIDWHIADNVVKLFNDENTIPFIARYRKNMTGGMKPDELRAIKESFDHAKAIKHRAATILKAVDKAGQWSPELHSAIVSTKSLDDLEHIYSLFKPASKRSLAERAKELGLGPISDSLLKGEHLPHLSSLVKSDKEGLLTEQQVKEGIIHIVAHTMIKDKVVFDKVKLLQKTCMIEIQTTQCKTTESSKDKKGSDKKKDSDEKKYEMYYNFSMSERDIKPHNILAINRGEVQKILNVKINLPDSLERMFKKFCFEHYKTAANASKFHSVLLNDSIDYTYKKFIKPLVTRRVRNEMKKRAEVASIEVFVTNVKQLLLTPPVRGKIILGIDPGFYHGCKLAVISEHGDVLDSDVIYPHKKSEASFKESSNTLIRLINKHKCTIVALGNGTACRETETFLTSLIKSKAFGSMDISYAIVDEAGASIYSCSPEAKTEFPDLDPNLISAISIARRLQDPLAELVKVEPKHLGVGMYQHDLPEKQLLVSLNEVISEAVSFVGVDVNTASHCLLKRVAGLNASRASNVIDWRIKNGPFKNREQLLNVKGIGSKTFEQCAGFIRILPETSNSDVKVKSESVKKSKDTPNLLDQTWIHPESYKTANEFLKHCKCSLHDLGSPSFIEKIKLCAQEGSANLAKKFGVEEATMDVIIQGLTMRKDEDIRLKANYPLFRNSMLSINDLSTGSILTGAVRNVTHFGAFVDVGVGVNGLVHNKWIKNHVLSIGQCIEVKVLSVERTRNRIGLELIKVL